MDILFWKEFSVSASFILIEVLSIEVLCYWK